MLGFFDIETNGLLDSLDRVHCIALLRECDDETQLFGPDEIEEALEALDTCTELVAHNAIGFDIPALKLACDWEPSEDTIITDTLVLSRLAFSEIELLDYRLKRLPRQYLGKHSLAAWGARLGFHKGDYGDTTDWAEYDEAMGEYCVRDVDVLHLLHTRLLAYLDQRTEIMPYNDLDCIDVEHFFAGVLEQQMDRGIGFNVKAATDLYAHLLGRREKVQKQIEKAIPPKVRKMKTPQFYEDPETGDQYRIKGDAPSAAVKRRLVAGPPKEKIIPFNPGSPKQVAEFLEKEYGWEPNEDELTPTGQPQITEEVLSALDYPEIKPIQEYAILKARIASLAEGETAWLKHEVNGRIHGRILHIGCVTHRCSHSKPNLGNITSVDKPYGLECRSLFVPRKGWVQLGCDLSGIELRMLAHYLAYYDGGAYAQEVLHGDIHTINQQAAGLETRAMAKTFIYALLYGAGDAKIGRIVGGSTAEGKELKARFFSSSPAFKKFARDVKRRTKSHGFMLGVDGRAIPVKAQHVAINCLLQGGGAIVSKVWLNLIHGWNGWPTPDPADAGQMAFAHDEVQWEAEPSIAEELGQSFCDAATEAGELCGLNLPIAAEFKIGKSWADTH